jgi:hypothetical protein
MRLRTSVQTRPETAAQPGVAVLVVAVEAGVDGIMVAVSDPAENITLAVDSRSVHCSDYVRKATLTATVAVCVHSAGMYLCARLRAITDEPQNLRWCNSRTLTRCFQNSCRACSVHTLSTLSSRRQQLTPTTTHQHHTAQYGCCANMTAGRDECCPPHTPVTGAYCTAPYGTLHTTPSSPNVLYSLHGLPLYISEERYRKKNP